MRNKLGFIVGKDFYPINGKGHNSTALDVIHRLGWLQEYHCYSRSDPKDFLILKKGAIQLGSSGNPKLLIYSSTKHTRVEIEKLQREYDLHMYKLIAY